MSIGKEFMIEEDYSLGFTTSSLRSQESLKLAKLYCELRDWELVRDFAVLNNTLQQRTTTSSSKLCRELLSRLRLLSAQEISYLTSISESEAMIVLFVAICRRYRFIREFVTEVLIEERRKLSGQLDYSDFDAFFNSKLSLHPRLNKVSEQTRKKIRQVVFNVLREVGILGSTIVST
jgi:hypothetical protein